MVTESTKATAAAEATFNEARTSNEIAREGMIAQHRPWMMLEIEKAGPVRMSRVGKVTVNIDFAAKNIGNNPAFDTMYSVRAYWTDSFNWPKAEHFDKQVGQTTRQPNQHANIVLPNDKTRFGFVDLVAENLRPQVVAKEGDDFTLVVVCCVVYKTKLSDKWFHTVQTAYVRRKIPPGGHVRDIRRFKWLNVPYTVDTDDLNASLSKSGGSSSIA